MPEITDWEHYVDLQSDEYHRLKEELDEYRMAEVHDLTTEDEVVSALIQGQVVATEREPCGD